MSWPADPQDIDVDLYAGGAWRDLVAAGHVRGDQGITIRRGRTAEGAQLGPCVATLTLDNRTCAYTPRNPTGPYYGTLGRNTPLRISLGITRDDFTRTVASGWGSAPDGTAWTTGSGTASDHAVTGGKGTHLLSAANTFRRCQLEAVAHTDVEIAVSMSLSAASITGAAAEAGVMLRGGTPWIYRTVRAQIAPGGAVSILVHDGSAAVGAVVATGYTWTAGTVLRLKGQVEGSTFRGKVWPTTAAEPLAWQVERASTNNLNARGWVGVYSGLVAGSGNAGTVFSYDDVDVRSPRFIGEVSRWPNAADVTGRDVRTSIEASGVLRRLGQGRAPEVSALRRAHTAATRPAPVAYWSLEDPTGSDQFASTTGGPPMRAAGATGAVTYASDSTFVASRALPVIGGGYSALAGDVAPYTSGTGLLRMLGLVKLPGAGLTGDGFPVFTLQVRDTTRPQLWSVQANAAGALRVRAFDNLGTIVVDSAYNGLALNGLGALVELRLLQNGGAGVDWSLVTTVAGVAGSTTISGTLAAANPGTAIKVTVGSNATLSGTTVGHVVVKTVDDPYSYDVVLVAHAGETAAARIARLCAEEGIPYTATGDPGKAALVGAQGPQAVLALIREAAEVDLGVLGESKGTLGLTYRTRADLYDQVPTLQLDQADRQLDREFTPVEDDQALRNQVTVKRSSGSSAVYRVATGPLSVAAPPAGVGLYDTEVTVNVYRDTQLPDQASWRAFQGTIDESRYPGVTVELAGLTAVQLAALRMPVWSMDCGRLLEVANPPTPRLPPGTVRVVVQGYEERITRHLHSLTWVGSPATAFEILRWAVAGHKWDSQASYLNAGVSSTATSMQVKVLDGTLWTTNPAQMPIPITVAGEQMLVTAISGTVSPQTFTVVRSVNGVVKSQAADAQVALTRRPTWAL